MPVESVPRIKVSDGASDYEILDSPTLTEREREGYDEGAIHTTSRTPARLIRNASSRTGGTHASSPPAVERPGTGAMDPLSHHILNRTTTDTGSGIGQRFRGSNAGMDTTTTPSELSQSLQSEAPSLGVRHSPTDPIHIGSLPNREPKKKGVSFLGRFGLGKKKNADSDSLDSESERGDGRTEGMNAEVFSSSVGANGFIPQHKEPPRYIKVHARNKKVGPEFNRMFLAQELSAGGKPGERPGSGPSEKCPGLTMGELPPRSSTSSRAEGGGAIWTTEFSIDGKYLAAAGQDQVVRVWAVISTLQERAEHEEQEAAAQGNGYQGTTERLSAPVFKSKPIREFEGHTGTVLDLSWSKNNFLLSSSMDKTVRLWHVSRQECLCTFKHRDFVTSIAFHPRDDRFFLAGSLDSVLRLWSIPDKSVAFSASLPDLITAVAFTPDGRAAMAGVLSGLCLFFETEGLKYHTQIHVKSSRGKNSKGSKITGIRTIVWPPDDPQGEVKILVSSNDSRVRIYNLRDKSLEMKLKGHENTSSQVRASFSDDGKYVICGSEDRRTFIWSTRDSDAERGGDKEKRPVEFFSSHNDVVTTSVMAPAKTRMLLGLSGDPLYDLCNPPPVTLLSREETRSTDLSKPRVSTDSDVPRAATREERPAAWMHRNRHDDGNIIITADHTGRIKVFRQDCAAVKRRNESWETGSTFSKKLNRNGTFMTRGSGGASRSRRNSVTAGFGIGNGNGNGNGFGHNAIPFGQSQRASTYMAGADSHNSQNHSHRHILDWAKGIHPSTGREGSIRSLGTTTTVTSGGGGTRTHSPTAARSDRSTSPGKSRTDPRTPSTASFDVSLRAANPASTARQAPYVNPPTSSSNEFKRPGRSATAPAKALDRKSRAGSAGSRDRDRDRDARAATLPPIPTPGFTVISASTTNLVPGAGARKSRDEQREERERERERERFNLRSLDPPSSRGYGFWNPSAWKAGTGTASAPASQGVSPGAVASPVGASPAGSDGFLNPLDRLPTKASRLSSDEEGRTPSPGVSPVGSFGEGVPGGAGMCCRRCGGEGFRERRGMGAGILGGGAKLVCSRCGMAVDS